jgi:hypothetical protein
MPMRERATKFPKTRFAEPDQRDLACPVLFAKTFRFRSAQITFTSAAVSSHRGAIAIVTNAGRDAVDANVLLTNGTGADGEVVWF